MHCKNRQPTRQGLPHRRDRGWHGPNGRTLEAKVMTDLIHFGFQSAALPRGRCIGPPPFNQRAVANGKLKHAIKSLGSQGAVLE